MTDTKYYKLIHPGGMGGVIVGKPSIKKKQDKRAKPLYMYLAVFFPKITKIGPASIYGHDATFRMASTPKAAIMKFMDGGPKKEKWKTYQDAGWKIRKIKIMDQGDP